MTRRKLTPEDRESILARWAKRDTYKSLADEYGTTWRMIQDVVTNNNQRKRDARRRKANAKAITRNPAA